MMLLWQILNVLGVACFGAGMLIAMRRNAKLEDVIINHRKILAAVTQLCNEALEQHSPTMNRVLRERFLARHAGDPDIAQRIPKEFN